LATGAERRARLEAGQGDSQAGNLID